MAYPITMETLPALSHEVWKRTPPEAQAYIRALEMRVATLEGMKQALQEQLYQTSRNSSRPPSSAPPHRERHPILGVPAVVVINRAILALRAP